MNKDKIVEALSKTGFPFENTVSEQFLGSNWNILGNKYYVDDVDGRAREIDLIAYKVRKVEGIELVCCGFLQL